MWIRSIHTNVNTQCALVATTNLLENHACCAYSISLKDIRWMIGMVHKANIFHYSGLLNRQKRELAGIRLVLILAIAFVNRMESTCIRPLPTVYLYNH